MKEIEELINLKDGYIANIETYTDYKNCDCDYESRYINQCIISLSKNIIEIEISQTDEYALSENYLMKLIISNIDIIKQQTEDEFIVWIKNNIKELAKEECCDFYVEVYKKE